MDLDAILQRRPQLVLVDELAHTNAPGSRHPKRYMDVEELLAAGIDVYTTLNIQHLESLNDVVAQITRVRVRETVPDSHPRPRRRDRAGRPDARRPAPAAEGGQGLCAASTARARAAALFLARQPDGAARAGAAPHRPAGRRADARLHARARHRGPWAAGERMLVCVDPGAGAANAGARRPAAGRPADARPGPRSMSRPPRMRAAEAERDRGSPRRCGWPSAGRRGGAVPGRDRRRGRSSTTPARNNVTHIVIGKSPRSRWFELPSGSLVDDLVRSGRASAVDSGAVRRRSREPPASRSTAARRCRADRPYLEGVLTIARWRCGVGRADRHASSACPTSRWSS